MWKPELNNKILPTRLPPMEGYQKETQYPGDIRTLLRELGKFLENIEMTGA